MLALIFLISLAMGYSLETVQSPAKVRELMQKDFMIMQEIRDKQVEVEKVSQSERNKEEIAKLKEEIKKLWAELPVAILFKHDQGVSVITHLLNNRQTTGFEIDERKDEELINLQLLCHLLLWHKQLELEVIPPLEAVSLEPKAHREDKAKCMMASLFDLELHSSGCDAEISSKQKDWKSDLFPDKIDLKGLALLNGDFVIKGLRLGENSRKKEVATGEESSMQKLRLEGNSEFHFTVEYYLTILNSAKKPELTLLHWKLRFMALFDFYPQVAGLVARMLIRELPMGMELPFPLITGSSAGKHAQIISFSRTKSDAYGIKLFNSGWGIDNHPSVQWERGPKRYSPFLGFKDIPPSMLHDSLLFKNLFGSGISDKQLYSGRLGMFTQLRKRWLYEDYLTHAMEVDELKDLPDYPKLIIDQRAGTCTSGAIKAFLKGTLKNDLYLEINSFAKIELTLTAIHLNAKRWLQEYGYKADVRYILRHIIRNIARRLKNPAKSVLVKIQESLADINRPVKLTEKIRANFSIQEDEIYALKAQDPPSRRKPPGLPIFPAMDISSIDDLVKFAKDLLAFFTNDRLLSAESRFIIFVRTIAQLQRLYEKDPEKIDHDQKNAKLPPLPAEDSEKKLVRIKILLALTCFWESVAKTRMGQFSSEDISFGGLMWDYNRYINVIQYYAALAEEIFYATSGKGGKPKLTLANCRMTEYSEVHSAISMEVFDLNKVWVSAENCLDFDEKAGPYVDSLEEWLDENEWQDEDISMDPKILEKCLKSDEDCDFGNVSPKEAELELLHRLNKSVIQLKPNIEGFRLTEVANDAVQYPLDGPSVYPLRFMASLQSESYLASHSLVSEIVHHLLATSVIYPKITKTKASIDDAVIRMRFERSFNLSPGDFARYPLTSVKISNPFDLEILLKPILDNIWTCIDAILDNLTMKPAKDIYQLSQYFTVAIYYENQMAVKSKDTRNLVSIIERLMDAKHKVIQSIEDGLLGQTTDSKGTLQMLILACYRTIIYLHSRKFPTGLVTDEHGAKTLGYNLTDAELRSVGEELYEYAKVFNDTINYNTSQLECDDFVIYYASSGRHDLYMNADLYRHVLGRLPDILMNIAKLNLLPEAKPENIRIDLFPLINYSLNGDETTSSVLVRNESKLAVRDSIDISAAAMADSQVALAYNRGIITFSGYGGFKIRVLNEEFSGKNYEGQFLYATSLTKGIMIDRLEKDILAVWNAKDKSILYMKWLPQDKPGSLYLARCKDGEKLAPVFKYLATVKMICLSQSSSADSASIFIALEGPTPLILEQDKDKIKLHDAKNGRADLIYAKGIEIKGAADLAKFPTFCSGEERCSLLIKGIEKSERHLIPLSMIQRGLFSLNPSDRHQVLILIYRLTRGYQYAEAQRFAENIDFEAPFQLEELKVLKNIITHQGKQAVNPESAVIMTTLISKVVNELKPDAAAQEKCHRFIASFGSSNRRKLKEEEPCKLLVKSYVIKVADRVNFRYRQHTGNLDNRQQLVNVKSPTKIYQLIRFYRMIGANSIPELWTKSAELLKMSQVPHVDSIEYKELDQPQMCYFGMIKHDKESEKSFEECMNALRKHWEGGSTSKLNDFEMNSKQNVFDFANKADGPFLLDSYYNAAYNANRYIIGAKNYLRRFPHGSTAEDYIEAQMRPVFDNPLEFVLPPLSEEAWSSSLPKVVNLWRERVKNELNPRTKSGTSKASITADCSRLKSLIAECKAGLEKLNQIEAKSVAVEPRPISELNVSLGSCAENIRVSWQSCLATESAQIKYIGAAYEAWQLMTAETVDDALDRVKACISRSDMACVRSTLECGTIGDSFLEHAIAYLQLKFIQNYLEKRPEILGSADYQKELAASNQSDKGLIGGFLTWQHANSFVLSQKQVDDVSEAVTIKDGTYPEIILQRIMASGKTFTLGPLITHGKADGRHLPVLIVPTALFETNSADLLRRQQLFFGQNGIPLRFDRLRDFTQAYGLIDMLGSFINMINDRGYVVTAPEPIQSMENSLIEMLDRKTACDQMVLDAMRLSLKLLSHRGAATIDEIDTIFNPSKELNYPIGEPARTDPVYIYMAALLQYLLVIEQKPVSFLLAGFKEKLQEEGSLWKSTLGKLTQLDDAFLVDPTRSKPEPTTLNEYNLIMWQQLHKWIPAQQESIVNQHFGRSIKYPDYWLAKPFKSAKVPSEESEFANPFETLNKTFAMYFANGLDMAQFEPFLHFTLQHAEELAGTKDLFGIKGAIDFADKHALLKTFNHALLHPNEASHKLALSALIHYLTLVAVPRDLQYYNTSVTSNALNMSSRFKSIMGYSGTLPNDFIFPERLRSRTEATSSMDPSQSVAAVSPIKWDQGAIGQIIVHLLQDRNSLVRKANKYHQDLPDMIRDIAGPAGRAKALIDVGALFKDHGNIEVAQRLIKHWTHVKAILFFHPETNRIVALKDEKIVALPAADLKTIMETLSIAANEYAIYFDQWHTTGTDITLPLNAHGVVTIGRKTTLRDLTQGVMRLRKFLSGQSVEMVVDAAVQGAATVLEVLEYTEMVAQTAITRENQQVAFAKLKAEVRAAILNAIINRDQLSVGEAHSIFDEVKGFLVQTEPSISEMYSGQLKEDIFLEALNYFKARLLQNVSKITLLHFNLEQLTENLNHIVAQAGALGKLNRIEPTIWVKAKNPISDAEQGISVERQTVRISQQEQQQEQEQSQETEMEQEQIAEKVSASGKKPKFESIPELGLTLTSDFELDSSCRYEEIQVGGLLVGGGILPIKQVLRLAGLEEPLNCLDNRLYISPEMGFINVDGKPSLSWWKDFQKPVQALLWSQKGNNDTKLAIISPIDAINLIQAFEGRREQLAKADINYAITDLAGTVFASSDHVRQPIGQLANMADIKPLLANVAILIGSYPMIKTLDPVKTEMNQCYGKILERSLRGEHLLEFRSNRKLMEKYKPEGISSQSVKEAPPVVTVTMQLPDEAKRKIKTCVQSQGSDCVDPDYVLSQIHHALKTDRTLKLEEIDQYCTLVLQAKSKTLTGGNGPTRIEKSKEKLLEEVLRRQKFRDVSKAVIRIRGILSVLQLSKRITK